MCGIFGIASSKNVIDDLLSGLQRLEYRGYDSSGIAAISGGEIICQKEKGKIINLANKISGKELSGTIGIAHTRWATHGPASEVNAHPHSSGDFAVVHNGIIENFKTIREFLEKQGYNFVSDTDTEVIPSLVDYYFKKHSDLNKAIVASLKKLEGAFAVAIITKHAPDTIIVVRRGSPLAIGISDEDNYIGSDAYVMAPYTNKIIYLDDDDFAFVTKDKVEVFDKDGNELSKTVKIINFQSIITGKEGYRHFMHKEIEEQPTIVANIVNTYFDRIENRIFFDSANIDFADVNRITIVACGTSAYAGEVAKYWFEKYAKTAVTVELASEFLYKDFIQDDDLFIFISQSGETADSLKALKLVKKAGKQNLLLVNAEASSMQNEADNHIFLHAGPEIGVASTKAFTAQLTVLGLLALKNATRKGTISQEEKLEKCRELRYVPKKLSNIINQTDEIKSLAQKLAHISHIIYIGRGTAYGLAKEAALKFKEISYIPAEGIAAGELKHGPIALIDEDLYVVVIAPSGHLFDKTYANIQEIAARGGKVIAMTDSKGKALLEDIASDVIIVPNCSEFTLPILYSLPMQYLAYFTAVTKGTDVDQPRNLAKSVTVE